LLRRLALCLALLLTPAAALAQSSPGIYVGQVPTAQQWNSYFAAKQDYSSILANPCTSSTSGLVPSPPGDPTQFLNGNCVWAPTIGLSPHAPVALATTTTLPSNTYNNGSSGIGATLTGTATGLLTIDGMAPTSGQRVLVDDEATGANDGVYTVTANSSGSHYVLTRAVDFDNPTVSGNLVPNSSFLVTGGTSNANTTWIMSTTGTITVGVTPLVFTEFTSANIYTAGAGLAIAGSVFSLAPISTGILGWASGGTGVPTSLSQAQVASLCGTFTSTASGCVPSPGSNPTYLLSASGWAAPPGAYTAGVGLALASSVFSLAPISKGVLGYVSTGTGAPVGLTQLQLTSLCNVFTSSLPGCVPSPGANSTYLLSASGWVAPAGGTYTAGTGLALAGSTFSLAYIASNTVLGNLNSFAYVPTPLNTAEITELCNVFTIYYSGCVPTTGSTLTDLAGNFLVANGTWTNTLNAIAPAWSTLTLDDAGTAGYNASIIFITPQRNWRIDAAGAETTGATTGDLAIADTTSGLYRWSIEATGGIIGWPSTGTYPGATGDLGAGTIDLPAFYGGVFFDGNPYGTEYGFNAPFSNTWQNVSALGIEEGGVNIISTHPNTPTIDDEYRYNLPGSQQLARFNEQWQQLSDVYQQVSYNDQVQPSATTSYLAVSGTWNTGDVALVTVSWNADNVGPAGAVNIGCTVNSSSGTYPNCSVNAIGAGGTSPLTILAGLSYQFDRATATGINAAATLTMAGRFFFDSQDTPVANTCQSGWYCEQYLTTRSIYRAGYAFAFTSSSHPSQMLAAGPTDLLDGPIGVIFYRLSPSGYNTNSVGDALQSIAWRTSIGAQAALMTAFIDNATTGAGQLTFTYGSAAAFAIGNGVSTDPIGNNLYNFDGAGTYRAPTTGGFFMGANTGMEYDGNLVLISVGGTSGITLDGAYSKGCSVGIISDSSGNITCAASDERVKNILGSAPYHGLDAIDALPQQVRWNWRPNSGLSDGGAEGWTAQQVIASMPDAKVVEGNGTLAYDHTVVEGALVNAVRELQRQVEDLKGKLKHDK
jgi:hypothetical protein